MYRFEGRNDVCWIENATTEFAEAIPQPLYSINVPPFDLVAGIASFEYLQAWATAAYEGVPAARPTGSGWKMTVGVFRQVEQELAGVGDCETIQSLYKAGVYLSTNSSESVFIPNTRA